MTPLRRPVLCFLAGCAVWLAGACDSRPTYPKTRLAHSLQALLTDEHLNASVRFIDHTLAVHLDYPNSLSLTQGQINIGPDFDDAARKVITDIHRVVLSTDAEVRFYVLLISDPKTPGAYLTMVRYMDDVRRANAQMLDTPEMFARTIFELNVVGPSPLTLEQYVPRDIHLEEFLSWQLARRVQHALTDELQTPGLATVGRCGGRFQNGEFVLTLDVEPPQGGALDDARIRQVFHTSTTVIAKVLSSYQFNSFNAIRLIHPLSGQNRVLPKTHLTAFR